MRKPRATTVIIAALSLLLLASLAVVGVLSVHYWGLKLAAKDLASQIGFVQATRDFNRGKRWLGEIRVYHGSTNDTGRSIDDGTWVSTRRQVEGKYDVQVVLVDADFLGSHLEVQAAYIDAYNQRMRRLVEHPQGVETNTPSLDAK